MLELKSLVCGHKNVPLFEPFSAKVGRGQIIFLLGRNGTGKTTLLRTLSGIARPVSGTVVASEKTVFLPSAVSVADTLSGLDIFEIYGTRENRWTQGGLTLTRPFSTLSSGEQKRILIAATLSHPAGLVLLDEPFNFLDWAHALDFVAELESQKDKGRSFIIATHQLEWALRAKTSEAWSIVDSREKSSRMIITGETKTVLEKHEFQNAFGVGIQVLKNPLDSTHVLALSKKLD